jgi:hypothetical protein
LKIRQHLLVASLNVGRRGVPLYWRAYTLAELKLKKRMSFYEREFVHALFADVLCGVESRRFVLTADRWFADACLLDLLGELGVSYVIRTKSNYHVRVESQWRRLDSLKEYARHWLAYQCDGDRILENLRWGTARLKGGLDLDPSAASWKRAYAWVEGIDAQSHPYNHVRSI